MLAKSSGGASFPPWGTRRCSRRAEQRGCLPATWWRPHRARRHRGGDLAAVRRRYSRRRSQPDPGVGALARRSPCTAPRAQQRRPGTRAYLSAGLPGADWRVAGATTASRDANVEPDEVERFFTERDLRASVGRRRLSEIDYSETSVSRCSSCGPAGRSRSRSWRKPSRCMTAKEATFDARAKATTSRRPAAPRPKSRAPDAASVA